MTVMKDALGARSDRIDNDLGFGSVWLYDYNNMPVSFYNHNLPALGATSARIRN